MGFLTALVAPLTNAWTAREDRKDKAHARRTQLIESKESHNHSWELAALEGDGWEIGLIRMGIYLEISTAVIVTVVSPEHGTKIWAALALIPEWIIGLHLTIAGWGFGSTPVKNVAAGLIGSVIKFPKG